ncbi:MAG: hypothetical protein U0V03_09645 [Bacteroidia bacterium]|jgi:hypothetical protein
MKNKNKTTAGKTAKIFGMLALACGLLISSCAKKGDTGPAGPAGTNGTNGNANVKSKTIFINGSEWTNTSGSSTVTKLIPEITSDIINTGAVLVYAEDVPGKWVALPVAQTTTAGVVLSFNYSIESGKINLFIDNNTTTTLTAGDIGNSNWRFVIMSGTGRLANPNVNYKNYNEVKKSFNLQD